ncbi:hypothetical protein QN397_07520 [Variovorax sp. RTB1]|uniref:hypothetical protein n=1 Tax=Variovorax sp. RTB1 TaxID=3048631 RepID=UPI002B22CD28|nr:hypothetical protein [Variovorax sp. RTB1]MEB0111199.1 hypothetical protein [Variovorax sp. RTB1]
MNRIAFGASLAGAVIAWLIAHRFEYFQNIPAWNFIGGIVIYSLLGSWIGQKVHESAFGPKRMFVWWILAFLAPFIILLVWAGAQ